MFFCLLAAIVFIGAGLVFFESRAAIARRLNDWGVLPRPERFTELYFDQYQRLHSALKAGTRQDLTFTVQNFEHRITTYNYQLVAVQPDNGIHQQLGSGTMTIQYNHAQTIQQHFVLPVLDKRIMLRYCTRPRESID